MSQTLFNHLLAESVEEKRVPKGRHLFHRDDRVHHIYLVLEGQIDLVRFHSDGKTAVLQRAFPGNILAEASLFADRYHCDAVASEPARVAYLRAAEVHSLLDNDPVLAKAWMRHLSNELQNSRKRAEIISLNKVSDRLDAWIAWNDGTKPPKGEWYKVAAEIGVSPEALYRELARRKLWRAPRAEE